MSNQIIEARNGYIDQLLAEIERMKIALSDAGEVISHKSQVLLEKDAEITRHRNLITSFTSWLGREQQIKSVCSDQWERGYYAALKRCDTEIWKTNSGGDKR